MTMKTVTAIALAASVLAMSGAAEAGGKKRHFKHGGHGIHFIFDQDYYGHKPRRSCRWLKRKAYYSGSRYWWKRYRRCVNRYY